MLVIVSSADLFFCTPYLQQCLGRIEGRPVRLLKIKPRTFTFFPLDCGWLKDEQEFVWYSCKNLGRFDRNKAYCNCFSFMPIVIQSSDIWFFTSFLESIINLQVALDI